MTYLLDTHTWIWMHSFPDQLSKPVAELLTHLEKDDALLLSAISLWEICKLIEKGKIVLREDLAVWVKAALNVPGLRVVPLDFEVFLGSTTLPQPFHNDPADQMIVATARLRDATIVTKDRQLHAYEHVRTVW